MFISSGNIKVYPTAFRGNTSGDTNSCLMSEENITNLRRVSEIDKFNNYINFIGSSGDYSVDLVLRGYRFIFNFSSASALPHTNNKNDLYAGIKVVNGELYPNASTNRILDEGGDFKGLTITDDPSIFTDNFTYIKIGYWEDSWKPFTTNNNLKLLSSEISNDNNGTKNIAEQFNTDQLGSTTDYVDNAYITRIDTDTIYLKNSDGQIYKDGKKVIVPDYRNVSDWSILGVVDGELQWVEAYDGSYDEV